MQTVIKPLKIYRLRFKKELFPSIHQIHSRRHFPLTYSTCSILYRYSNDRPYPSSSPYYSSTYTSHTSNQFSGGMANVGTNTSHPDATTMNHISSHGSGMPPHGNSHMPPSHGNSHMPPSHGNSHMPPPHGNGHMVPPHGNGHMPTPHGSGQIPSHEEQQSNHWRWKRVVGIFGFVMGGVLGFYFYWRKRVGSAERGFLNAHAVLVNLIRQSLSRLRDTDELLVVYAAALQQTNSNAEDASTTSASNFDVHDVQPSKVCYLMDEKSRSKIRLDLNETFLYDRSLLEAQHDNVIDQLLCVRDVCSELIIEACHLQTNLYEEPLDITRLWYDIQYWRSNSARIHKVRTLAESFNKKGGEISRRQLDVEQSLGIQNSIASRDTTIRHLREFIDKFEYQLGNQKNK